MGTPIPGVRYYYDPTATAFRAPGRPDLGRLPTADENFRPVSYATLADAREALGAPADANYVTWAWGNTDLETVFANHLGDNDILVLPERPEPYLIDSSKGFMAAGVLAIDGTDSAGKKDGSKVPIVQNPRLWFAMSRGRRGILGMGPGVVIEPSASSFSAPRQPILQDQAEGDRFQLRYNADGSTSIVNGAPQKLIEFTHATPFVANFEMRSRAFGGVSYSAINMDGSGHKTVKRLYLNGAWRGHHGVPNGETGGVNMLNGTYTVEHVDLRPVGGTSPLMWNRTKGGTVKHARSTRPEFGMWTFWKCGGANVFENVYIESRQTGINLEEEDAGFSLDWTGGTFSLEYPGNKFHFAINPVNGSVKINLKGVICSENAYTPGAMTANVYLSAGVTTSPQKRSDVTCDTLPVSHVPASRWVP